MSFEVEEIVSFLISLIFGLFQVKLTLESIIWCHGVGFYPFYLLK